MHTDPIFISAYSFIGRHDSYLYLASGGNISPASLILQLDDGHL